MVLKSFCTDIFIILIFCCVVFSGCKKNAKKELSSEELLIAQNIQKLLFEDLQYNNKEYYYPPQLEELINKTVFDMDGHKFLLEKQCPSYAFYLYFAQNYNSDEDSFDWLEDTILHQQEERIARELALMEKNAAGVQGLFDDFDDDSKEKFFVSDEAQFVSMEFEKEIIMRQTNGNDKILVTSEDNKIKRKFYDDKQRPTKIEQWEIKDFNNTNLILTQEYFYNQNQNFPYLKTSKSEDSLEKSYYNSNNLVEKFEKYILKDEREIKNLEISYEYNKKDKLIKLEETDFIYKDKDLKKLKEKFVKHTDYFYVFDDDSIPANYNYYENGVIKIKNTYTQEKGTYTSRIYFDDSYSVETSYLKNKRVKDVYIIDGNVRRVKKYD